MRRVLVVSAVLAVAGAAVTLGVTLGGVAGSSGPAAVASVPPTARVVLRPVDRDGAPAAGWRVDTERVTGFTCTEGASPSAVDPGIRSCGYTALGTVSCWRSSGHTVLCLRDAYRRELVRIAYSGTFAAVAAPAHPAPQGVTLTTGTRCHVRDGGAWDRVVGHPDWVGTYWCASTTLYGPPAGFGIDTSTRQWTVHEVSGTGAGQRVTDRLVARAYYVGTAARPAA